MAIDKTIEDAPVVDTEEEDVDPEEQETVMFGQRHLFKEGELASAARRQRELTVDKERKHAKDDAADGWDEESAEEAEESDTLDIQPEEVVTLQDATVPEIAQKHLDEPKKTPVNGEPTPKTDDEQAIPPPPQKDKAKKQLSPSESDVDNSKKKKTERRRVAERRPPERRRDDKGAAPKECTCKICGRAVSWPRARHFRGSRNSTHGFRCSTCGNVFCSTHVMRVSGFWESLFHHGMFRCLLCELAQVSKAQTKTTSGTTKHQTSPQHTSSSHRSKKSTRSKTKQHDKDKPRKKAH